MVVLGYSRLLWLRFYARQTMTVLADGLESAFASFEGVPQELLFEQMRSLECAGVPGRERVDEEQAFQDAQVLARRNVVHANGRAEARVVDELARVFGEDLQQPRHHRRACGPPLPRTRLKIKACLRLLKRLQTSSSACTPPPGPRALMKMLKPSSWQRAATGPSLSAARLIRRDGPPALLVR